MVSELGRTPLLNAEVGKDHWPVTSAMLIGEQVDGGRVIGATDDAFGSRNVDLATGRVDDNGTPLRHSNLAAGILKLAGVDPEPHLSATPLEL